MSQLDCRTKKLRRLSTAHRIWATTIRATGAFFRLGDHTGDLPRIAGKQRSQRADVASVKCDRVHSRFTRNPLGAGCSADEPVVVAVKRVIAREGDQLAPGPGPRQFHRRPTAPDPARLRRQQLRHHHELDPPLLPLQGPGVRTA